MSKVEFITTGDPHLCIDVQCPAGRHPETFYDEQRAKLKFLRDYCKEHSIPYYVCAGDLLNYKNPSVYTPNSIISLVHEMKELGTDLEILSISGNHDLKMSSREMKAKSVYNIFAKSGLVTDIHGQTRHLYSGTGGKEDPSVTISGIDYNHSKEDLLREISELNQKLNKLDTNILVIHEHLLPNDETLPFSQHINYGEFLQFDNLSIVCSGHLHKGFPTETLSSINIEDDNAEASTEITFVNPWSLTRVARDNYAMNDEHTPELVHVTIEDGKVSYKHVIIPHKDFDSAFFKESLNNLEHQKLDISEFVSSLGTFEEEETQSLVVIDKSAAVKEKIEYYMELAESKG